MAEEDTTVVQLLPLLMEYLILTLPTFPEVVQVMVCVEPTAHFSPPLGDVTVITGFEEVTIEKTESLVSLGLPSVSLILTLQLEEETAGTVQE